MGRWRSSEFDRSSTCEMSQLLPTFAAWILILGLSAVYFVFPGYQLALQYHFAIPLVSAILLLAAIANLAAATFMNPGFLPRATADEPIPAEVPATYRLVVVNGIQVKLKYCVSCNFYRPPRVSHCSTCNRCLEIFDHHCPWVANCIGRRNYRYFFIFLNVLTLHIAVVIAACLFWILTHTESLLTTNGAVTLALVVVVGLLALPVGGLTFFHMSLVARGMTTNEQVTGKFRNADNPFDEGCCYNCCLALCGPLYPNALYTKVDDKEALRKPLVQGDGSKRADAGLFSPSSSPTATFTHTATFSRVSKEHNSLSSIESTEEPTLPPSTSLLAGTPRSGIRRVHQLPGVPASPIYNQRNLMQQVDHAAVTAPLLTKQQPPPPPPLSAPVPYPTFQPGRLPASPRFTVTRKSGSPEYDNIPSSTSRQSALQVKSPSQNEASTVPVVTFKNVGTRRGPEVTNNYPRSVVVDERPRLSSPANVNNSFPVNVQRGATRDNAKPPSSLSNSGAATTESYGSLLKKSIESQRQ
ncbi:hypothetical protein RvY_01664 [Ramazzottius varieornatus]|uniref:Palmitoyltransferase n=1 Tax=Ramazzottius varieornatus TaxID=947166 RepID=A0A1D1UH64_RAMVA|nr:hypothetical protein RvY_01664 [Ramazzottius varieornatus]